MTDLSSKVKNTLDEGRILIIGAQVLLGFQFRAVFEQGFEQLPSHGKYLSLVSLGVMVLAVSLLIWPASYHQIVEKERTAWRFSGLEPLSSISLCCRSRSVSRSTFSSLVS